MPIFKKSIPYNRRVVIYAIFDVLDCFQSSYEQKLTGDIKASVTVFEKTSDFAFAVTGQSENSSILHITILRPAETLTIKEQNLAVRYLGDNILHHIDETNNFYSESKTEILKNALLINPYIYIRITTSNILS